MVLPASAPDGTLPSDKSAVSFRPRRSGRLGPKIRAPHIPAIDGLRAVAVLAVVAFHLNALPGGFLGVDLFFVISGFVITSMLLFERATTDHIKLGRFWWRRAKRLLPALLTVLVVVQLWLHAVAPEGLDTVVNGQTLSALFNLTNWFNIFTDFGYWDASGDSSPLNHLWSLAIEEQFYILFPLFLLLLRTRRAIGVAAAGGIVASIALTVTVGTGWSFDRLYQGTDVRVVALLAGVLLATILVRTSAEREHGRFIVHHSVARKAASALAVVAVAVTATMWAFVPLGKQIFDGMLLAATLLEAVILALVVVSPAGWLTRVLQMKPLVFVGKRSYALYLWHWPVIVIVSETHTGLSGLPLTLARMCAIIILTLLSYTLIENPIRRSSASPGRTVGGIVVSAALIITLAFVPASTTAALMPKPIPLVTHQTVPTPPPSEQPVEEIDDGDWSSLPVVPGQNIMVVGDSWAVNLGEGMDDPSFGTTTQNEGIGGCGILNPEAYQGDAGAPFAPAPQCMTWEVDWQAAVAKKRPDAVVIVAGNWDQRYAQVDGEWVSPGDATFDARYAQQLDRALAIFTAQGIPVYASTTVTLNDAQERSQAMNTLIRAAVERNTAAQLLDLGGYLCRPSETTECPATRDGQPIYDATGHPAPYWQIMMAGYALGIVTTAVAGS